MLVFVSVTRTRNAAKPNGFIVKEFSIAKSDKNWTISLLPGNCGSHIPLLAVVNADRNADSTRDSAVFTKKGLNSSALVTRLQKASPRVRGTFNIHYHGKVVTGKYIKPMLLLWSSSTYMDHRSHRCNEINSILCRPTENFSGSNPNYKPNHLAVSEVLRPRGHQMTPCNDYTK